MELIQFIEFQKTRGTLFLLALQPALTKECSGGCGVESVSGSNDTSWLKG